MYIIWSIHMHKKMVKEIAMIRDMAEKYKIDYYSWHVNAPIGNATSIINDRPTSSELVPYKKYLKKMSKIYKSEGKITKEALRGKVIGNKNYVKKEFPNATFSITHDYSVYVFFRGISSYSYCGNLKKEGASKILQNYIKDNVPCLEIKRKISQKYLAMLYGNEKSDAIYTAGSLMNHWYWQYWKDNNNKFSK